MADMSSSDSETEVVPRMVPIGRMNTINPAQAVLTLEDDGTFITSIGLKEHRDTRFHKHAQVVSNIESKLRKVTTMTCVAIDLLKNRIRATRVRARGQKGGAEVGVESRIRVRSVGRRLRSLWFSRRLRLKVRKGEKAKLSPEYVM
eukprot:674875-Amorphochlora_amoeboformis.AAC.2